MDKFIRYVEEVCYSCIGESCFSKGLSVDGINFASYKLVDIHTVRDDKVIYNCRNSIDNGRVFIVKLLVNAYRAGNISKAELRDIYKIDFSEYPNTKLALTQKGFLLNDLVGAVLNDKFRVPALVFNQLTNLRMSDIIWDNFRSNDTLSKDSVYNFMRRLNLQLLMYGYVNNFNVGFILDKLYILCDKILEVDGSFAGIPLANKTFSSFLNYIIGCIFDLPLDVYNFELECTPATLEGSVKDSINSLNNLSDNTRLNLLYNILGVNCFDDLVESIDGLLNVASSVEETKKQMQTTQHFLAHNNVNLTLSEKDNIIAQLEERIKNLEDELSSANSVIEDKRAHISDLNKEISKLRSNLTSTHISTPTMADCTDSSVIENVVEDSEKSEKIVLDYLNSHNVCIIGGHIKLNNALRKVLPGTTIVEREDSLDDWKLKYKDIVIINTLFNYHKCTEKVRANRRKGQTLFIITASSYRQFITECYDYICHLVDN